ncbi:ABC transporter ATP-binding protein [Arthrobacter sp. H14]|uniref:ABC transporter ATP-binding protein n=1 Tax=Arthrobacter sp. H14 TaxID=1312959 RepID=UPI00047A346A|nr:ABC transporter ATP-binding protein [Arthrobacter sp. H14]
MSEVRNSQPANRDEPVLLSVQNLQVHFAVRGAAGKQTVHAVEDISFDLKRGETLGLVGESGSGKSTIANALMRLEDPTGGRIMLEGIDIATLRGSDLKSVRRRLAMVFQDPFSALNPRQRIGLSIAEPLVVHKLANGGAERSKRVRELLDLVNLPAHFADRFPHELSGGQRQRVCIARALAGDPDIMILDEATASLDVSVQAQIMNLLKDLQRRLGLTYLFVSHDLAAVEYMSHRVLVMYLGRLMEISPRDELYTQSAHPYTRALLAAIPLADPVAERSRERTLLEGEVPSPLNPPSGCVFRTRCPIAVDECSEVVPAAIEVGEDHNSACIRVPVAQEL